ncbi:PepSY-associated TM helix domain-containing protein, partial [Komagataeibacter rhaeticus]|uniref:PepSY-associated TM helix domain-containing protein n=1 Tax=Komagataeibacter rhaeticus TaxID=215221 RepID=UPI0039ED0B50
MRETLRTRMGWLHAWTGFVGGLVMVCVFMTGSLSVFDTEITRWMQPEVRVAPGTPLTPAALDVAARMIHEGETHGIPAFLALPSPRSPTLKVLHYDGREFTGPQLDPQTGVIIPARQTAGGEFFFRFHYTLCMQGLAGILAVDIPAIGLLVAIGSGLVIHIRALLPDIVLLRLSATRLRAWLDAHLLTGVLFLPFMVMITYTGVLVHVDRLLPAIPVTSLWSQGRPVSRSTAIRPPHVAPSPVFQPLPPLA